MTAIGGYFLMMRMYAPKMAVKVPAILHNLFLPCLRTICCHIRKATYLQVHEAEVCIPEPGLRCLEPISPAHCIRRVHQTVLGSPASALVGYLPSSEARSQ